MMKKYITFVKVLSMPILILIIYMMACLLLNGKSGVGMGLIPPYIMEFCVFLYFTMLNMVVFHQFFIRKQFKSFWVQCLFAIGLFLTLYLACLVSFGELVNHVPLPLHLLFMVALGVIMQCLEMILFREE